ncbi:GntR family transcriptional regulator [Pusillimonas sp. SM2304]|uniref:GntR family transcriptional regulator n=1 Tax=Pusillimonas sp. SM2304 TaxID=3073241 RepID=UPI0028740E93|nr:GntR family transcriptional regulator [Pusillimonas sp. SM2304]MDS1139858.1 GntR family transcriptional regulator [Pusillimonas sp. SM2304]
MTQALGNHKKSNQRETSTQRVYQGIRQKILDNHFAPGMQILEQELVAMFSVSRTPIREALVKLEHEDLVEIIPRHGMRVTQMSVSDMREIYEVLASLEATAAELAARSLPSRDDLLPFEQACERMERALKEDDLEAWAAADEAFHLHLLQLCGNRRLAQIVMKFWNQAHRVRYVTLRLAPPPRLSSKEHLAMIDAIRKGDAQAARNHFYNRRTRGGNEQIEMLKRFRMLPID